MREYSFLHFLEDVGHYFLLGGFLLFFVEKGWISPEHYPVSFALGFILLIVMYVIRIFEEDLP